MESIFSRKHKIIALDSDSLRGDTKALEIEGKLKKSPSYDYLSWSTLISEIQRVIEIFLKESVDEKGGEIDYTSPLDHTPRIDLKSILTPHLEKHLKGLYYIDSTEDSLSVQERNKAWIPKMLEVFQGDAPSFFFFGAGHLQGKCGIINLLKQKGYELRRINRDGTFTIEDERSFLASRGAK